MNRTDLHELLIRLKAEAAESTELDADARVRLTHLIGEVEGKLRARDEDESPSLGDRLKESAVAFENRHPAIGTLLEQLGLAFSTSGI